MIKWVGVLNLFYLDIAIIHLSFKLELHDFVDVG